jgi:hypothetical protein
VALKSWSATQNPHSTAKIGRMHHHSPQECGKGAEPAAGQGAGKVRSALDVVAQKVFGTKWRILFTRRFCRCTVRPAFAAAGWFAAEAVLKGVFRTKCRPQISVGRSRSVVQKGICCCPSPAAQCCVSGLLRRTLTAVCAGTPALDVRTQPPRWLRFPSRTR